MSRSLDVVTAESAVSRILGITNELNRLQDVDAILDRILFEARRLSKADAGSIFLVEDGKLRFSYMQNDTLFGKQSLTPAVYSNFSVPIDETSIVGYVAKTGEILVIDDAYQLNPERPYSFNRSYDEKSGYRTTSIMTIPLRSFEDRLLGVMQIINAMDEENKFTSFGPDSRIYLPLFASHATGAIERSRMTREIILRMMRMAELHDPRETGQHVQRVGAFAAEIYHRYALNKGYSREQIRYMKGMIRLAAMLHDVGKIGVPDSVLKKPGKLTGEEFDLMKLHTLKGARLFSQPTSELDRLCGAIAMHHHEKWNGTGYPGHWTENATQTEQPQPLSGENIPLGARIVAVADVYDALMSVRCYKEPWPEERVLETLRKDAGSHFDPEVVEAFFQIHDVIVAIREKYQEIPAQAAACRTVVAP
ncbi:MAG: HD domain-containing protein [Desulfocurvibacter africanus]